MWKMGLLKVEIVLLLNLFLVSGDVVNNDISENSLELTQSLNLARQQLIQETCRRFPPKYGLDELPRRQLEHILIDDKYKLLYCFVPRVACTNWKRILMILTGKLNTTDVLSIPGSIPRSPGMFRRLNTVSRPKRDDMLKNYHKLIIVRNPFERLLSAFRSKLEGNEPNDLYFRDRIGKRIIKAYRENPSKKSLEFGHDVTFKEFALFLTTPAQELAGIMNDGHWRPYTNLCHPCLIKYNLVGKYETLVEDSQLALHTINATHIQFPRLDHTSGTAEKLHSYFSQLDLPLIRRLYMVYKNDFRMFNYHLDNIVDFENERIKKKLFLMHKPKLHYKKKILNLPHTDST